MAFYKEDPKMASSLKDLIHRFEQEGRPGLHKNISISWIRYSESNPITFSGEGAGWLSDQLIYPASIVKVIYAIAIEAWIQKKLLYESQEINRATHEMIVNSSNNATSYIVDLLTATTSGPSLKNKTWESWRIQRQLINKWLRELQWEELKKLNCCQKTWDDGPYGREKDFYGLDNENRNAMTTKATARIFEAIMTNGVLTPIATKKVKGLLRRSLDIIERKSNPENQIDGFIGEGLPIGTEFWSKAGLTSEVRHDAAWWQAPNRKPMLLVIFTTSRQLSKDNYLLPAIANELNKCSYQLE